jgi:hypothetical protein
MEQCSKIYDRITLKVNSLEIKVHLIHLTWWTQWCNLCDSSYSKWRGKATASSRLAQAKLVGSYLRNKIQTKQLGVWLKSQNIWLAHVRPWVQAPVPNKKVNTQLTEHHSFPQ